MDSSPLIENFPRKARASQKGGEKVCLKVAMFATKTSSFSRLTGYAKTVQKTENKNLFIKSND